MFSLDNPWWEYIARAALVYFGLLVMVRLSGKRTVGQFTPFDLLVVMLMSEAVSSSLSFGDESVSAGLLVAGCLIAFSSLLGFAASRINAVEKLVDGSPVLIGRDGKLFDDVLKRHRISEAEVEQALREHDVSRADMRIAMLESDGSISILTR